MEDDERTQKLKAGKQKLAEFQKKRKKKKIPASKDVKENVSMATEQSEASLSSSGDVSYSDSDQGNTESGADDTRTLMKTRTALYAAYDRIEELEESLAGKQLALDKVISENDGLQRKLHDSKLMELESAVKKREELIVQLSSALQTVTNQVPSDVIATEMAEEIQNLKTQLLNASRMLETQTEKYKATTQTLEVAKTEIARLQQHLWERDKGHRGQSSPGTNQEAPSQIKTTSGSPAVEVLQLQQELQAAQSQIATLQEKVRELDTGSEARTSQTPGQMEALQEVIRTKDNQVSDLEAQLAAIEEDRDKMRRNMACLEAQIIEYNSLSQENQQLKTDILRQQETSQLELEQMRREKDELQESLENVNEKFTKETESLKNERNELKQKISDLENSIQEVEELKIKMRGLEEKLAATEEKVGVDSGELDLLKTDYELLTDTLKLKNERIQELEQKVINEKHEIEMELLRGDNERLSQEVNHLVEKLESSEKNIAEKGRRLDALREEGEELRERLGEREKELAVYVTSVNSLQREKEQQALDLDQLNEELEEALVRCKRTEELEQGHEELTSQLYAIQQECQCYQIQNDELRNRINVQHDLSLSQQCQIEVAGREKEQLMKDSQQLGRENEELMQEILKLRLTVKNSDLAKPDEEAVEKLRSMETVINRLKEDNLAWKVKVQSLEDQIVGLQKDLEVSQDNSGSETEKLQDFYKQELLDKDEVINSLQSEIQKLREMENKPRLHEGTGMVEWQRAKSSGSDSIEDSKMESMVEDLLYQNEAAVEREVESQKEAAAENWERENVCEEMEMVQEEILSVSCRKLMSSPGEHYNQEKVKQVECSEGSNPPVYQRKFSHDSLVADENLEDDVMDEMGQSLQSEVESFKREKSQEEIRSVLNLEPDVSLDSENFLLILKTLESQKNQLLKKLKQTEAERDKLRSLVAGGDEILDDSLNTDDSIDVENLESGSEPRPQPVVEEITEREAVDDIPVNDSEVEDAVDGPDSLEMEDNTMATKFSQTIPPREERDRGSEGSEVTRTTREGQTQLEGLKSEYESQVNSLRDELSRQPRGEISEQSVRDIFQQEMELFRENLDTDRQQQLEAIIGGVGERIQEFQRQQHTQYQDELNLHLQAMRLTLEQIYQGQIEIMTSEQEQRHLLALQELRDSLNKEHAEELSRLESDWTSRMSELEREHEDELNDSLLEDSLIVQTIEIDYPHGSEANQSRLLHKLNKKLSEEHRQLLKKISEGLDRNEPRPRTPRKHRHTQGQQTDSEDGETDSIVSLPVTGTEFLHLDERERAVHNAQDVQQTLEIQREEISSLRSRMLEEYEQLLTTRADVMATQTQEVEKLQREMEDLQQSYEEQIKVFQTKVEEQSEVAMLNRLKEEHDKEVRDITDQYTSQISQLHTQLEAAKQEVTSLKQEVTSLQHQDVTSSGDVIDDTGKRCDESVRDSMENTEEVRSEVQALQKLLETKSNEVDELNEKLELESQLNIELREKMTLTENRLSEMENLLKEKQRYVDEVKNKLQQNEARMKREKEEREESGQESSGSDENSEELRDKLMRLQQELEASQEQERVLEEQYDELQHQHREQMEALRQDLEHENRAEITEVQSEFKVQLEIELKRQAADMTYDHSEKIKKMKEDHQQEMEDLRKRMEDMQTTAKESEKAAEKFTTDAAVNTDHLSADSYPESSELPVDDEPDSLSRSTETASTVIDALRNAQPPRGNSQDLGDKTDDELEEMESETGDQSVKPSRMEDVTRGDTMRESDDLEDISESSSTETSETSQSVAAVSQLMGKINSAKQETFMKLKQEYEAKINKLTEDLEQAMILNDEREKCLDENTERYEEKINEMRVHYEMRIRSLEESDIDVEEIKEKVKTEFVKNYEAELARVHVEYEEKMELVKQEMTENFDSEKQEMEKKFKSDLEEAEEKYDTLMDRIRGGDAPEVADLVRDRIDTELEMAKTLMQQEFEETIESEQARFADLQDEFEKNLIEEKEREIRELQAAHEDQIDQSRREVTEEFQVKLDKMETDYNQEIERLQAKMEAGVGHALVTEQEIQEYRDKIRNLEAEIERLARGGESSDEKCSDRLVDESGVLVSASSEFDTDGETRDSGKGSVGKKVDQTDSKAGSKEKDLELKSESSELRDSGGVISDVSESQGERRDSSSDLDNSIRNLKGSHAAAMAEIEEEYNAKLASLKTDLEKDYQAKLDKLKQELSSTTSSLPDAGEGHRAERDDLDIDHIEELRDLEVRLTEKHSHDLFDLENQYKNRIQEIQTNHQEEIKNLKKVLEYLQQSPVSDEETQKSQVVRTMSSPVPKRSTPVEELEKEGSHGSPAPPLPGDKLESSGDQTGSPLLPPTEKPPAVPRDAGIDLVSEEDQTPAPSMEAAPVEEEFPNSPRSRGSTPTDLLQTLSADLLTQGLQTVKSFGSSTEFSTSEQHTETVSLATELKDKEVKIKELEKEIESLQSKFSELVERREREGEESRNLEVMLRTDLERVHSERESTQATNDHLLQLLSEAVKTYLCVEDLINRKLAGIVAGGHPGDQSSPSLHRRSPPSGSHPRSPPSGQRRSPTEPGSPGGAEGGDVPPHETSILSNLTDEGLDLSQRTITESIFQGPDLDTEGEELLTDASNRLQGSVSRLLDMIEDTTQQLYDTKRTQHDLVTTVSSEQQGSISMTTRCEELEERLREEVEAKEYLAMELHKAEGLIEGYSTERDQRELQVRDLEEKAEALVLELETTKNKLIDLETSHHEATSLRNEMQRQQELLNNNVGDQAQAVTKGTIAAPSREQALMLELNKLNEEKRALQQQLRVTTETHDKRVGELERAGEETEGHYVKLLEEKKSELEDLRLQLDSVEKQLKSNRQFLEEQANEREQERDEFNREVQKLKKALSDQEKKQAAENRLQREVDTLTEELQDRIDSHSEIVMQTERLQRDLSDKQMTTEELTAVVRQLEQEIEERAKTEQAYKLKIRQLEQLLERRQSVSEMSDKMAVGEGEEECEETSESESTGSETRSMRRRRKLPSHISIQQEEALFQEKEQLQLQLEDQLKQMSALRNQLDEMRHRGDYSGGFLDDSQTVSLQRQVDNQREVMEENQKEISELKEQLNDLTEAINNKDKQISQLTNQIQNSSQTSQSESEKQNAMADLKQENEDLKRRLRSLEREVDTTPMSVLTQNLIEEKNQEIDHLNQQLDRIRFEMAALKSGEALKELQTEVDKLRSDLHQKEMELVRASQASTFSDLSDTDGGIPAASESFTEKTSLQQELEDSVAQKMEEFEQVKSALQQKEEEIVSQQQTLQEKEEVIAGLNMTLDEKVKELENVSKELIDQREKSQVTSPVCDDAYLNEILQEKEMLIEQMNTQIEGLSEEVVSLTEFQNKLQEDFDTVQQMLEEKEREIDTLTKELSERMPGEDHSEELLKLEMEISKLKKDLKEKDNVIEEKEEEMYLLNEKLEQQQEMQIDPEKLSAKESEITALQHQLTDLTQLKAALEEKTHDLEVKTREIEEIHAELTQVKEQLVAGGDIQTKVDQTGSVNFELMLKEKEMELERVRTEFAEFRKELQSTAQGLELGDSCQRIQQLQQELAAVRRLVKQDEQGENVLQKMMEVQRLRDQLAGIRDLVRDGKASEIHLSKEEVDTLRKRLETTDLNEKMTQLAEEMLKLGSKYLNADYQEKLQEKEEEVEAKELEIRKQGAEILKLKEKVDEQEAEIQRLQGDLKSLADKENEIQCLQDELDRTDERELEIKRLREELSRKSDEIQEFKRDMTDLARKDKQIHSLKSELENSEGRNDIEVQKMSSRFVERDPPGSVPQLHRKEAGLQERDVQSECSKPDLTAPQDEETKIEYLKLASLSPREKDGEIVRLRQKLSTRDKQVQELEKDLGSLSEKEREIEMLRTEIQKMVENQECWEEERIFHLASPRAKEFSRQDSAKEEEETLRVKVTSLEEEVDHLKEEVKNKAGEITQLGSEAEKKEMEIEKQRGEIETYKQKQEEQFQKLRAFEEQLAEVKRQGQETELAWSQLQTAEERLEQVTQELGVARIKLTEAEQNLGVVGTQLLEKENQLQAVQTELWDKAARFTEELQLSSKQLKERDEEIHKLRSTAPGSEVRLEALLREKEGELEEVKERLREAVDLGEQQLRVVEQKDDEFTKLKLEIQQMIAEKDKTIRDLKKQLASQSSSSELEMSQLQQEVASKTETLEELEKELRRLEIIQGSSLEAGGDAVNLVNILRDQLRQRDEAFKEIHRNLQKSEEELRSRGQELESKSRELVEVRSMLDNASSPRKNLSQEAEQQFRQLEQELKIAKEALAEMQRRADNGESRESSVERSVFRRGGSGSSDLDLMEQEELHDLVVSLRHDLDNSKSEVALLRKSASMSSKDFVQKVMELREELSSQHQRHIQDLTDRNRLESDSSLAQLRIKYEDEIEHMKKIHVKELAQKVGETKRELEKLHKTEINSLLARHKHEIEMLRIREPVYDAHDASVLNLANQLGSEVALTERLDSELIRSLSQRPDGQDTASVSDLADSEVSMDGNVPSRLQVLMKRLHQEGVEMLSLSELLFLKQHMPPSQLDREVDLRSLQAAWENEKQSLLSAVQSLKDLLAQTHRVRGVDKESYANFCDIPLTSDVSDWRGELLRSIGFVFAKERETLLAELRSHVLSHPNVNLGDIQKLEQKIRNQEAHQKSSLEQIFSADRQSLLAEIRDLRAHTNVSVLRHQEEKERLTEQLNSVEDQTSKRERQLKRQDGGDSVMVQLLEYKLQQEKIIQDDLRTSLEVERDRTSDLVSQLGREKNSNLDLQTDLSNQQLQVSKLKDALEREQSRFISVTTIWNNLVGALEDEKTKCQHLSELLERERAALRQLRSKVDQIKLESDSKDRNEYLLERLQSELSIERDRRLEAENAQELEKVALASLRQDLELERKNLRSAEAEHKARVKQLSTAVELERAKSNDLQGALERERGVNDKLRENLDSERRSLLESTDRENSIFEDMQLELDSERAKVNDLKNSMEREKQRLQSQVTALETQTSALKDDLEQERLTCRQLKNEIDQIQLQKLDITRHYEHERDQVARLKAERELLRSEVKSVKDILNEKERTRDTEKVSERRSHRQLERERDDQKMKMHENELELQRLTQRILDLEDQATASREREMEAVRELQQEKFRTSHHRSVSDGSEEDGDHWTVYRTQLESICQSLQYLILQYQNQLSSGVEGAVDVLSLEKSLKDLLSELRQTQTPLAFESDTTDNLMGRPDPQAIQERVLHHNSELTNFVSRLTEEKMELRNTLGRLEEEIWRYRQRSTEHQNGHNLSENHIDNENQHLEARAAWAKERLSLQLTLNQREQELENCRADLRAERERRGGLAGASTEGDRVQRLYGKYLRADSYRKALVYQKKYLLLLLGGFQDCEQTTLALIARMGAYPSPEHMQVTARHRRPFTVFRSAARVVVAVSRMRFLVKKWKRATRVGSPVMGGSVDLQQGYTPNSNSFSPPRINTQSRLNGSGPICSHASSPLHPSFHQSPYSHLSSSFVQRDFLNGSTPHYSPGGASSGYHANSNGVTNGMSPYQAVGGVSESYLANGNISVHMTPPTRDYSSKPHPTSENSGARRKILSSSSSTPTKPVIPSPARRVRITEPEPSSYHDDYISRLESLQQRLSGMESGSPKSRLFPRR
uniref:A-kinase anchor protein 9-like isoform X5 n=1 Tax=Crassostrea virginica TaxID=6565 RepID=A0A8B8BP57_CRAVI|nr:A-kinase anchor protein 9-like isoform X5 [Crassostrea virginica]